MSSYKCERCYATFQTPGKLKRHLTSRKTPCDFLCAQCGIKLANECQYRRHLETKCEPKPSVTNNEQHNVNAPNVIGNSNVIVTNNTNICFDITNVNPSTVRRTGIVALEKEQENLLSLHGRTLYKFFNQHIDLEDSDSDDKLKTLFLSITQLFHSNPNTPENINIIDKSADSKHNIVFDSPRFVTDPFSKLMRNKRIIQLVIQNIEKFITIEHVVIKERIKPFCTNIFIPFICKQYNNDTFPLELQVYWQNNKKMLESINYKQMPTYELHTLTDEVIDNQLKDYNKQEDIIMGKLAAHYKYINALEQKQIEQLRVRRNNRISLETAFNVSGNRSNNDPNDMFPIDDEIDFN